MSIELMEHQGAGAEFLAGRSEALLYWDQGTGKTYAAVRALDLARDFDIEEGVATQPALVLCPAVARRNWAREIKKAQRYGRTVVIMETSKTDIADADVVVCSYDMARRLDAFRRLTATTWSVLILDELQYLKNPLTAQTKAVFGHRGGGYTKSGIVGKAAQVWALSGTPAPNHIGEMLPWVKLVDPANFGRLMTEAFTREHCQVEETVFGYRVVGNRMHQVERLWNTTLAPTTMRVFKSEVLKDLPPMRFVDVEVPGGSHAQIAAIQHAERPYVQDIDALLEHLTNAGGQTADHLTTVRRITEAAKVGNCIDMISAELRDRALDKVVIFANFIDNIEALAEGFKDFGVVKVHGGVPDGVRQAGIDRFQTDPDTRVFVGQILAAGTAITLHADGACQDVVFVSADWVPANNAQAAARVHRMGQTGSVMCRFLKLSYSTDEVVQDTLMRKTRMLSEAFNEKRGHHAS